MRGVLTRGISKYRSTDQNVKNIAMPKACNEVTDATTVEGMRLDLPLGMGHWHGSLVSRTPKENYVFTGLQIGQN